MNTGLTKKQWGIVFVVYVGVALAVTWPLVRFAHKMLPLGSEGTPTVPLFNLWTLGWNVNRLAHGLQNYWDAPIFYPVRGSFAFSEPQPLTGLLAGVFWWLGPALAYNLVLWLFLVLNGVSVLVLLRRRGVRTGVAVLVGMLAMLLPYLAQERGVLQLQPFFGVVMAIDGLWWLAERPSLLAGIWLGVGVASTFLTSEYYALFLGVVLATAVPFLLPQFLRRSVWLPLLLAGGIVAVFVLPVALPQLHILHRMGFSRSENTITIGSANWRDYTQPPHVLWISEYLPTVSGRHQHLFPGGMLVVLAGVGIWLGWQQSSRRRWIAWLTTAVFTTLLFSIGLNLKIGDWQPYQLFREFVPGFDNLRNPFRFALFTQIHLLLLTTPAWERLAKRPFPHTLLIAILALTELIPKPARLTPIPPPMPTQDITPPAIFLPFPQESATAAYAPTTSWMAATIHNPIPLINGYSGYFPRLNSQLKELLADFPTPLALHTLRALGTKTILLEPASLTTEQTERLQQAIAKGELLPGPQIATWQSYQLTNSRLHRATEFDGGWVLQATPGKTAVRVAAFAAIPDASIYLVSPFTAPLNWELHLQAPNGTTQIYPIRPTGSLLLYHGSDRWLTFTIPRPQANGRYTLTLFDTSTNHQLAHTNFTLP